MSAAYDTAYQYIQDDVNRPDLAATIARYIARSVLKQHRRDTYARDTVEKPIVFQDPTQLIQHINISSLPRYRKVRYLRRTGGPTDTQIIAQTLNENNFLNFLLGAGLYTTYGPFLKEISPENAEDYFGFERSNVFYQGGAALKLFGSGYGGMSAVLIGYYADPDVSNIEVCDSWILRDYPTLIAADVSRKIFKIIGKDEEARAANMDYQEEILTLAAATIRASVE